MFPLLSESSAEVPHAESGFSELAFRIEKIEFSAKSDRLTATYAHLGSLRPGESFERAVDGLSVRLMRCGKEFVLKIGSGPLAFDVSRLAELKDNADRVKQSFFGADGQLELRRCDMALYCHSSDGLRTLAFDRISRAAWKVASIDDGELTSCLFGGVGGGRQVELSVGSGGYGPGDSGPYPPLRENANYRPDRRVLRMRLAFFWPFIRKLTRGAEEDCIGLDLPDLLKELVCVTLGEETLPNPFFRVASWDSGQLPAFRRRNSPAWEFIRRAFLGAVSMPVSEPEAVEAEPRRHLRDALFGRFTRRG